MQHPYPLVGHIGLGIAFAYRQYQLNFDRAVPQSTTKRIHQTMPTLPIIFQLCKSPFAAAPRHPPFVRRPAK
eukprot:443680-Pelagomonas_calceolata.AAC.1